jgi:hypothetical protein
MTDWRSAPEHSQAAAPFDGEPGVPESAGPDGGGQGTGLPTGPQLDRLEADLDHVDAVLAQLDEEP